MRLIDKCSNDMDWISEVNLRDIYIYTKDRTLSYPLDRNGLR